MADVKPLTIPALIAAMKEAGFATREDVEEISLQTADAILEGQAPIYERLDKIEAKLVEHDQRFEKLEAGQVRLEVGQVHLKDEIQGLKADLSDTPSRAEHNALKERVAVLENRH